MSRRPAPFPKRQKALSKQERKDFEKQNEVRLKQRSEARLGFTPRRNAAYARAWKIHPWGGEEEEEEEEESSETEPEDTESEETEDESETAYGEENKKYLEERARLNLVAEQAAGALAKATQAFKREDLLAKRALQAKQRREITRIKVQKSRVANKEQAIAAIRSRIARDPQRSAAIERYKARRRRILKNMYADRDLGEVDSSDDEEDNMSEEEEDNWLASEDEGFNVDEDEYMAVVQGGAIGKDILESDLTPKLRQQGLQAMSEADREARAVIRRARAALPPVTAKVSEKEFEEARTKLLKRGALIAFTEDELRARGMQREVAAGGGGGKKPRRGTLLPVTGVGGGAGLLSGGVGAEPAPSKRRAELPTVAPSEVLVNPHFYVPEPAPPDEKEKLDVNELRILTPDDIVELLVDADAEIEERMRGSRGVDGRWDLSGFSAEKLVRLRDHVVSMQHMFAYGLISTEAAPQKATGIGAMFHRMFLS